jgi:hypothetical protein
MRERTSVAGRVAGKREGRERTAGERENRERRMAEETSNGEWSGE